MNKKFISAVMALVVVIGIGFTNVHADPSSDKAKIQQIKAKSVDLENKVEIMDNQIEIVMSEINKNENNISKTQENIKSSQIDITKAENNIKTEQNLFNERMKVMYMSGSSSYVEVLMGSNDLGDFISRLDNLENIMKFDQSVINNYKEKKSSIVLKKVSLNTQNSKLLSLKANNNKKLADLTKQKSDQTIMVAQLKIQESQYGTKLLADQASVAASQVAIQQIRNSTPSTKISTQASGKLIASAQKPTSSSETSTPASSVAAPSVNKIIPSVKKSTSNSKQSAPSTPVSRGATAVSSNSVIAYASNFLGIAYVWGGSSPSGFDCSGFTQYVFSHFGVNLPRVSEDQQNVGTYVSRDNLKPGDLVFFGNPAYHVGIYVGNGNMIDAPHTGTVIKIQKLNSDFTCGRRVN